MKYREAPAAPTVCSSAGAYSYWIPPTPSRCLEDRLLDESQIGAVGLLRHPGQAAGQPVLEIDHRYLGDHVAQRMERLAAPGALDHLRAARQDALDGLEILAQPVEFLQRDDDVDAASAFARHHQLGDPI